MGKKSSEKFYRQCRYERLLSNGRTKFNVSWLPEKLAKVGKYIYFGEKQDDVQPDDLWIVVSAGDNRRSAEFLNWKHTADAHQRDHSDV